MAAAVVELVNRSASGSPTTIDWMYHTFSAGCNLKPHPLPDSIFDSTSGTASMERGHASGGGAVPRSEDQVHADVGAASWSGRLGPVRALVQGSGMFGQVAGPMRPGLPWQGWTGVRGAGPQLRCRGRQCGGLCGSGFGHCAALCGGVVGHGRWRPDGPPNCTGFNPYPYRTTIQMTGTSWFAHLDTSNAFSARDYACPARFQGPGVANVNTPGWRPRSIRGAGHPGTQWAGGGDVNPTQVVAGQQNPYATGIAVSQTRRLAHGGTECTHTVTSPLTTAWGIDPILGSNRPYEQSGHAAGRCGAKGVPAEGL